MSENSKILSAINALLQNRAFVLVAIDGRCGAGKTTLANELQRHLSCNLIHMDDFFLRPAQRMPARLAEPGGNIDYERFANEVLCPLAQNKAFSYRPYDCHTQALGAPIAVPSAKIALVEGSYACHPRFWDAYHLHIFKDIAQEEQIRRIVSRNGEQAAKEFAARWIPMEETYFKAFSVQEKCELSV